MQRGKVIIVSVVIVVVHMRIAISKDLGIRVVIGIKRLEMKNISYIDFLVLAKTLEARKSEF